MVRSAGDTAKKEARGQGRAGVSRFENMRERELRTLLAT